MSSLSVVRLRGPKCRQPESHRHPGPLDNRREGALPAHDIAVCGGHREAPAENVATMYVAWRSSDPLPPVIPHGRAGISMAGGLLNVSKGNPGVKCAGDERVPEAVRADPLCDSRPPGKPLDGPIGGVAVHPSALGAEEDRSRRSLANVEVDCPRRAGGQRDSDVLAALTGDLERSVPTLEVEVIDVGA